MKAKTSIQGYAILREIGNKLNTVSYKNVTDLLNLKP